MNDFDAIFVQVAVEKQMLNTHQAKRAQELIEAAGGASSTGELLVKNGLLNSMQVKDILRVQMERIKHGQIKPNPMPTEPKDDGASQTLMVNAADLFGSPNAAPTAPVATGGKAKAEPDPGSQTLALNFNDILNANSGKSAAADEGSQTLALNAVDLFGGTIPTIPGKSETAKPALASAAAKPAANPAANQPAIQMPAAKAAAAEPFNPPPMQTLALNAADLFGGAVTDAGSKLSSVRSEKPMGSGKSPVPSAAAAPAAKPVAPPPAPKPAEPDPGNQTLSLNAADLFGGMEIPADSAPPTAKAPAKPAAAPAAAKPAEAAQPKADVLNAFDIFGLPMDAPVQQPVAKPAAPAKPAAAETEGNTLSLNAADLFGSSAPGVPGKQPTAGAATTADRPAVASSTHPPIEPPMPGREPKPNQIYGNLKIIKRLGEGNMAIVFLGEYTDSHKQVALKFLKPEVAANSTSVKRFVREAESAQKIKHSNVLETYKVSEFRGWHFMEMELMVGEDIRSLMKRGTVPLAQALTLCIAAAEGLQAAHEQGVIHRDIKPENLMIMDGGRLKIADFGLARVQEAAGLTMPGQMLGTPAYMAPEQWEGKTPDARTDIYALGVTLYDMITARRPVEGTTAGAIIQTLFGKGPTPIEEVNPALPKSIIELANAMVKVNPDERPKSMAEVLKRMRAALEEISAPADGAAPIPKNEALGATMVSDQGDQAQLQAELKALKVAQDTAQANADDEATMKMAPGELQKVLGSAPTDAEVKKITHNNEATMAMSQDDVIQMQRALADTELKKDKVRQTTDDGGALRKVLIAAIVLVVVGILGVICVAVYLYLQEASVQTQLPPLKPPLRMLATLLRL